MSDSSLHIFGIRHHGPGSARSLERALEALQPDIVLVEGPPDAQDALALAAHEQMEPPVALLVYRPDDPQRASYFPFAQFSPEWVAIRYGMQGNVGVRFIDLPQTHQFAIADEAMQKFGAEMKAHLETHNAEQDDGSTEVVEAEQSTSEKNDSEQSTLDAQTSVPEADPRRDPLKWIAEAAGYNDSERWWEDMVEHRDAEHDVFDAVLEAMRALREEMEKYEAEKLGNESDQSTLEAPGGWFDTQIEPRREAWMRSCIRAAKSEGFGRIAVVCGAWHAPALESTLEDSALEKSDVALLKGLPKCKVAATWVPWTNGRLCSASGYGAGIESPGWYGHLWESRDQVATRWMARVAKILRDEDLDVSSAHVIEAVRLSETLATLRNRPLPGLPELGEATQSILCFGSDLPLQLIHNKLIVGEKMGTVPDDVPGVPLQLDLAREQKRLRMQPEATQKTLDLDLRKPNDRDRSTLLHRLNLLGVPWGATENYSGSAKGTFHEVWRVQWQPEFTIRLIEAGAWGNTILAAATSHARRRADESKELPPLTSLLDEVLLASLPDATSHVMAKLQAAAAVASDVGHLMDALPALCRILRYGDVRGTDGAMVSTVVDGLVARICIGLPLACASLDDEAAAAMYEKINSVHAAIALIENAEHIQSWNATLSGLSNSPSLHGLIAGRCCRLLLDGSTLNVEEAARRLSLALSVANEPSQSAAWIEGFLKGSAAQLLHDETLWRVLDEWVAELSTDIFTQILPLLRRTFSTWSFPERRQLGERAKRGSALGIQGSASSFSSNDFDAARAAATLPILAQLLGLTVPSGDQAVRL